LKVWRYGPIAEITQPIISRENLSASSATRRFHPRIVRTGNVNLLTPRLATRAAADGMSASQSTISKRDCGQRINRCVTRGIPCGEERKSSRPSGLELQLSSLKRQQFCRRVNWLLNHIAIAGNATDPSVRAANNPLLFDAASEIVLRSI
jgi:hypothetical protein